jgi:hypothetical protein
MNGSTGLQKYRCSAEFSPSQPQGGTEDGYAPGP